MDAGDWIRELGLAPHPEGGHYRETYRSALALEPGRGGVPASYPGPRACATAIHFLLAAGEFSAFHRIRSDELWFFHAGGPLELFRLGAGAPIRHVLGAEPPAAPQALVPAGEWFAARPLAGSRFCLVSCVVAPGFDFADFEMATRTELLARYPDQAGLIAALTPDAGGAKGV